MIQAHCVIRRKIFVLYMFVESMILTLIPQLTNM